MEEGKKFLLFPEDLPLSDVPTDLRPCYTLCREIRGETALPILVSYDPGEARRLWPGKVGTAMLWAQSDGACIILTQRDVPHRAIYHELLHLRLHWVDRAGSPWAPAHKQQDWVAGFNNDIEHLIMVPQEREHYADESYQHWMRELIAPDKRWFRQGGQAKYIAYMQWLSVRELLRPEHRQMVEQELLIVGLFDEADAFADRVVAAIPDKKAMWGVVFDTMGRPDGYVWRTPDFTTSGYVDTPLP